MCNQFLPIILSPPSLGLFTCWRHLLKNNNQPTKHKRKSESCSVSLQVWLFQGETMYNNKYSSFLLFYTAWGVNTTTPQTKKVNRKETKTRHPPLIWPSAGCMTRVWLWEKLTCFIISFPSWWTKLKKRASHRGSGIALWPEALRCP